MNLAQLIDPEWLRDGALTRFARRGAAADEPAPSSEVRQVQAEEMAQGRARPPAQRARAPRGEVQLKILRAVDGLTRPIGGEATLTRIATAVNRSLSACSARLICYVDAGYLARSGSMYHYSYRLTAKGGEYLEARSDA